MEYLHVMSSTKAKTKNNSNKQTKTQDSVEKLQVYRIQIALFTQISKDLALLFKSMLQTLR